MGLLVLGTVELVDECVGRVGGEAGWCSGGIVIIDANTNLRPVSMLCWVGWLRVSRLLDCHLCNLVELIGGEW